ncbi:LamB/YcsF family protein [Sporolactobacillus sp. THM7-4]|nr:LamB/YcsF family protein [Sporolactobacillus sp. THM7-4]
MKYIDLNGDLGESFGAYKIGNDQELIKLVTSVNIACGFHAGDPHVMKQTAAFAAREGRAIGAHPGYPDLNGFGRRKMDLSANEVYDIVVYQIGALAAFAKTVKVRLNHVKPHGALYNAAARDQKLADAIAGAVKDVDPSLILYGLSGSCLIEAGKAAGLRTASEVFADRTYQPDGTLTPRTQPGALIEDESDALRQVLDMVHHGIVRTAGGRTVPIQADTLCVHGDGAHALAFAKKIRLALEEDGIEIRPL